jgi:hypothetical protein
VKLSSRFPKAKLREKYSLFRDTLDKNWRSGADEHSLPFDRTVSFLSSKIAVRKSSTTPEAGNRESSIDSQWFGRLSLMVASSPQWP